MRLYMVLRLDIMILWKGVFLFPYLKAALQWCIFWTFPTVPLVLILYVFTHLVISSTYFNNLTVLICCENTKSHAYSIVATCIWMYSINNIVIFGFVPESQHLSSALEDISEYQHISYIPEHTFFAMIRQMCLSKVSTFWGRIFYRLTINFLSKMTSVLGNSKLYWEIIIKYLRHLLHHVREQ